MVKQMMRKFPPADLDQERAAAPFFLRQAFLLG
jgi:hypothetical protein